MNTLYGDSIFESNLDILYNSVMESSKLFEDFDITINESAGDKIKEIIDTVIKKVREFFKWIKTSVQAFVRGFKRGLNSDIDKKTHEAQQKVSSDKKDELNAFLKERAPIGFMGQCTAKRFSQEIDSNLYNDCATSIEINEEDSCKRYYIQSIMLGSAATGHIKEFGTNLFVIYNDKAVIDNYTFAKEYKYWCEDITSYIDEIGRLESEFNKKINELNKTIKADEASIENSKIDHKCRTLSFTIRHITYIVKDLTEALNSISNYATKYNVQISKFLNSER